MCPTTLRAFVIYAYVMCLPYMPAPDLLEKFTVIEEKIAVDRQVVLGIFLCQGGKLVNELQSTFDVSLRFSERREKGSESMSESRGREERGVRNEEREEKSDERARDEAGGEARDGGRSTTETLTISGAKLFT